ncbi:MAG: S16 family serine protease, partial [Nanoarchaeota archaeon]
MQRKLYFISLIILFSLFSIIPTTAQKIGHITLLAVSEATQIGSTADLYLRVQEGSGGVYIDTFPLTKLDTQLSTRFAQQIACDFVEEECAEKDFFYTIRSDATIIGGPSAGAALATLTVAMLDDHIINESVAITGTINVGGLIGPVGSLVGKIDAAKASGMTKVLIPKGSRYELKPEVSYNWLLLDANASFYRTNNETNASEIDLYAYGNNVSVEVKEVG